MNAFRKWKWFDRCILLMIILNCVFLALYDPRLKEDEGINAICAIADMGFTIIFTLEMSVKWTAIGIGPYYRDGAISTLF